jgi:hypothetical protein
VANAFEDIEAARLTKRRHVDAGNATLKERVAELDLEVELMTEVVASEW